MTKWCSGCKKFHDESAFSKRGDGGKGLRSQCKKYRAKEGTERNTAWRAAHPEEARERDHARRVAKGDEIREQERARYAADPEKGRAKSHNYYTRHQEKCRASQRARYARNKPKATAYVTKRHAENPILRMHACVVAEFNLALKTGKASHYLEFLLDCPIAQVIKEFEEKFALYGPDPSGRVMSWENHHRFGWHVEHIVPFHVWRKLLTDPEQVLKSCWNHTNLRPWWSADNWTKGANIPGYKREPKPWMPRAS